MTLSISIVWLSSGVPQAATRSPISMLPLLSSLSPAFVMGSIYICQFPHLRDQPCKNFMPVFISYAINLRERLSVWKLWPPLERIRITSRETALLQSCDSSEAMRSIPSFSDPRESWACTPFFLPKNNDLLQDPLQAITLIFHQLHLRFYEFSPFA